MKCSKRMPIISPNYLASGNAQISPDWSANEIS